jgi:hypothetical protein
MMVPTRRSTGRNEVASKTVASGAAKILGTIPSPVSSDPLRGAYFGIEHAQRHIEELVRQTTAVTTGKDSIYQPVVEKSADGSEDILKVRLTQPLPELLSGIAFDAVSNLRAALDRATLAAAVAAGRTGNTIEAKFPFAISAGELKARKGKWHFKHIPGPIFDEIVTALKPYPGGNDSLWAVNKLCNIYKHEIVVPTVATASRITFNHSDKTYLEHPLPWDASTHEVEIGRLPKRRWFERSAQFPGTFTFGIALAERKRLGEIEASMALMNMLYSVRIAVETIEFVGRRHGLFS